MKHLILLLFLALNTSAYSQAPTDWAWLYGASGATATSMATTANGDIYLCGNFRDTATFGNSIITAAGSMDVFIAKINAAGTIAWLKQIGSTNIERAYAIKTHDHAVYIYGGFTDTLLLGNNKLICNGSEDVFVAKLDTAGNYIWAQGGGSTGKEFIYAKGMTVDKKGNVYITGDLQTTTTATFGNATIPGNPYGGFFLVKYNPSGYTEWATSGAIDSAHNAAPLDIKADENDNVYVTGGYSGKLTLGATTLTGYGDDAFLVKYSPAGNVVWATTIGGNSRTTGMAVCCDKNNNIFVTGQSYGDLTFGGITSPGGVSGRNTEIFIAKYDSTGNALWARRAGTHERNPMYILTHDMESDNNGSVYITGGYYDTLDFYNNGVIAQTDKKNQDNIFVAKYDANGNTLWAIEGGGRGGEAPAALHLSNQSLYVAGSFTNVDSTKFGFHTFKANKTNNQENLFIAKIANATGIKTATSGQNNIAVYPNPAENYFVVSGITKGTIISVYDIAGKKIKTVTATGNKERIETTGFLKGNYTITVSSATEELYYRLTKL